MVNGHLSSQEDVVDRAPTSASLNGPVCEFLTYGKYVSTAGGPVLFGRDYSATSKSAGLSNWKAEGLQPWGLLPKFGWAPELIDPLAKPGCLVVVPVRNPAAPGEEGVAVARIRYRSENGETAAGESKPGRVYLQSTALFLPLEGWRPHALALLKVAEELRAVPDIAGRPAQRDITVPVVPPPSWDPPDLTKEPGVARIVDRFLTHLEGKGSPPLVLGAESFESEALFLAAVGSAIVWLGDLGDQPFGFATGLASRADALILHWLPGQRIEPATTPLSKQQLKQPKLNNRRAALLNKRPKQKRVATSAASAASIRDLGRPPRFTFCDDELTRFFQRCQEAANAHAAMPLSLTPSHGGQETPPAKTSPEPLTPSAKTSLPEPQTPLAKASLPELQTLAMISHRDQLAPWQKSLNDYRNSPSGQSARALLAQIRDEDMRDEDLSPDSEDGLRKLVLIAAHDAAADRNLPLRYVPFEIIDWGFQVIEQAAADTSPSSPAGERVNKAADLLKERVNSAIGAMGVLCPDEIDEIKQLQQLAIVLENANSSVLNDTKEMSELLYRTVNKFKPDLASLQHTENAINARIERNQEDQRIYPQSGKLGEIIREQMAMLREVKGKLGVKRMDLATLPGVVR
jgi:hypothetical protein